MAQTRTTLSISLPAPLRAWVDRQAKAGEYGTSGKYVQHLLLRVRQEQAELEKLLLDGLASGPSRPFDAAMKARVIRKGKAEARAIQERRAARILPAPRRKSA